MSWAAPIAFAGLALLALPIAIHLMGLGRAKVRPFPSLRFLESSRLLPSRRTRIHDAALLAVRVVIIAAATLALARPVAPPSEAPSVARGAARVVIVDTSASMLRAVVPDAARAIADSVVRGASAVLTVQTHRMRDEIAGAADWLASQSGGGELVLISDFQIGTIDAADLAGLPSSVAVRAVRVPVRTVTASESRIVHGGRGYTTRAVVQDGQTVATWTPAGAFPTAADTGGAVAAGGRLVLLADDAERPGVVRAVAAARAIARPLAPSADGHRIVILHPRFGSRQAVLRAGSAVSAPWQGDVIRRLQRDSLLVAMAAHAVADGVEPLPPAAAVVARAESGEPMVGALADRDGDVERLVLVLRTAADSPTAVALHASLARASSDDAGERDPAVLGDSAVNALARVGAPTGSSGDGLPRPPAVSAVAAGGPSYARWLWLAALAALGGEALYRRALAARVRVAGPPDA